MFRSSDRRRVVGPTYRVVDGNDSIVRSIVLDDTFGSESTIEDMKESDSELKRAEKKMAEDMSKVRRNCKSKERSDEDVERER